VNFKIVRTHSITGGGDMTEYIHLIGAEDVRKAGNDINSAAQQKSQSVNYLIEAMDKLSADLSSLMYRFEETQRRREL